MLFDFYSANRCGANHSDEGGRGQALERDKIPAPLSILMLAIDYDGIIHHPWQNSNQLGRVTGCPVVRSELLDPKLPDLRVTQSQNVVDIHRSTAVRLP